MPGVAARLLLGLLPLPLVGLGWLATAEVAAEKPAAQATWVRTRDGWEKASWRLAKTDREPPVHPWVVASFIGLASALGLVAVCGGRKSAGGSTATLLVSAEDRL